MSGRSRGNGLSVFYVVLLLGVGIAAAAGWLMWRGQEQTARAPRSDVPEWLASFVRPEFLAMPQEASGSGGGRGIRTHDDASAP